MEGNMNKKVYDKYNCVFMFKLVCSKNSVWSDIAMIYRVGYLQGGRKSMLSNLCESIGFYSLCV